MRAPPPNTARPHPPLIATEMPLFTCSLFQMPLDFLTGGALPSAQLGAFPASPWSQRKPSTPPPAPARKFFCKKPKAGRTRESVQVTSLLQRAKLPSQPVSAEGGAGRTQAERTQAGS